MKTFNTTNFSDMYYDMLEWGYTYNGTYTQSRVGEAMDLGPAYFEIQDDEFRLPYLMKRNLNPFFALAEFSWLISGSNELKPLEHYIKDYNKFSDDGETLNGAYGHRLRHYFEYDQIQKAIDSLATNPNSRRIVLSMWSVDDLSVESNDLPCNISIILKIRNHKLDITVLNRSNDLFLGVPYNVFVFYLLQVYISEKLGIKAGTQRHFTNCLHIYKKDMDKISKVIAANNKTALKAISSRIPSFTSSLYVRENHNKVNRQEYKGLLDDDISNFFQSYKVYIESNDLERAVDQLPHNLLGYVAFLWYCEKKDFKHTSKFFEEVLKEANMKEDLQRLETIKYEDASNIKSFILELAKKHISLAIDFINIVNEKSHFYSFKVHAVDKEKLVQSVFLSLVMCSIASNMAPNTRQLFTQRLKQATEELELVFEDILHFTKFESKIRNLIENC
ncbi:thymidylate synthase [Paenibacillus sp. PL2-23]|uniref:thymidylate synthase n=1 Tax=Paenibacillus sp. PL2-23 TaxID=2100729 RepID=UPI0030FB0869